MKDYDNIDSSMIVVVGVLFVALAFAVVVALQAMFFNAWEEERERKVVSRPFEELSGLVAEQQGLLNSYGWVDKASGVVGIPIERAMELTARAPQTPPGAAPHAGESVNE